MTTVEKQILWLFLTTMTKFHLFQNYFSTVLRWLIAVKVPNMLLKLQTNKVAVNDGKCNVPINV